MYCCRCSPRGLNIAGQDDSYDFGSGAGFYVNATSGEWSKNYKMYDYVTKELPDLVASLFPVDPTRMSVTGHSMGGHGALVAFLKNPGAYASVSAFAPICNPTQVPWGQKAFQGYLGSVEAGKEYDATELVAKYQGPQPPILIDQVRKQHLKNHAAQGVFFHGGFGVYSCFLSRC